MVSTPEKLHPDIARILLPQDTIDTKITELAQRITEDYSGKDLIVVGMLKGAFVFLSDLVRKIGLDIAVDFMTVSSYGRSTESSGNVKIMMDISSDLHGRHVLLVEDILDTGATLSGIRDLIKLRNPESIKICTLLDKPSRRKAPISGDYVGFEVPDEFIVGFGLDYAEKYRNLPYIGILKPEAFQK